MNDTEVTKTIHQMVRFIKQEAEEKASEIMISAEEEFNITKLQLMEAEKQKIRREFQRRESAIEVKKKVQRSKQLNESRLRVLQAREDAMQALLKDAQSHLAKLGTNSVAYKQLLLKLLLQSLKKLGESDVLVKCREIDLPLVNDIVRGLSESYKNEYKIAAPDVKVDSLYLPPPPKAGQDEEHETCTGGIVAASSDNKIVCSNTLDDRLRIGYLSSVPRIRALLFES